MFSTLTERNGILKTRSTDPHFLTCVVCAFSALRDPFLPQEQRIKVLMFCY